ncbi:MAG: TonB-dependent receptor [Magnetococcales bacterium]|nr:TonB-dependent receptor [Magnetococcales bacterium]
MARLTGRILVGVLVLLWSINGTAGVDLAMLQNEGDDEDVLLELYGEEEVISLATGSDKPLHLAPSVATVITAEDIRRSGATNLDQILEQVPGLHVAISSTSRVESIYMIRGIFTGYNPQVLVLLNGLPFPHLFSSGRPNNFQLPVASIARVEVIRGPGSALYGADAFTGVINIKTKSAADIHGTEVGFRGGSFDTYQGWLQQSVQLGDWDLALSLEASTTNGDRGRIITSDLQTTFDQISGTNLSLAPGPLETENTMYNGVFEATKQNWTARVWGWTHVNGGMGAGGAQALDSEGRQNIDQYMVDLIYHNPVWTPSWDVQVRLNYFYSLNNTYFKLFQDGVVFPDGTAYPNGWIGNPGTSDRIAGLETTNLYSGIDDHRLRFVLGGKYMDEKTREKKNFGVGVVPGVLTDVTNDPTAVYIGNNDRWVAYMAAQDEWSFAPDWALTAGVRLDRYSDFGSTVNPRFALVWSPLYNLTSKLMYGQAFRAPSFAELYVVNNPGILGNANLEPETIETWELAFDYRPTFSLRTGLNLFYYQIEDLIDYVEDANGITSTAQNARDIQGHGLELEMNWKPSETVKIDGSMAWMRAVVENNDTRIHNAPTWQTHLQGWWSFMPEWSVMAEWYWIADRAREFGDNRSQVDDYNVVNLVLRNQNAGKFIGVKNWEAALLVKNLFDSKAIEPAPAQVPNDYPLEGLAIFGELRFKLGAE